MTEQTILASKRCPLVGVAVAPWLGSCSLISILSHKKNSIFAQQLEEEMEEPLGSRILVGYDNAHEENEKGGRLRDGWSNGEEKGGGCSRSSEW